MSFRQSLKMKHLAKTVKLDKSKFKNKIKFKLDEEKKGIKNMNNNDRKYIIDLLSNKSNTCAKIGIIVILSLIVALEIIATILIIYFYDYIK